VQQEFNNGRHSNSRIDYWTLQLVYGDTIPVLRTSDAHQAVLGEK